jgi:hypothetical protein
MSIYGNESVDPIDLLTERDATLNEPLSTYPIVSLIKFVSY